MRSLLLPLLALAGCGQDSTPASNSAADRPVASVPKPAEAAGQLDRSHAGSPAPATRFEDPEGDPASLADFRGKPVLLNLWATWCAPCVAEMPTLDRLAGRQGERLQVLTVSQDPDGRDKVEAFFRKQGYRNLETWLDPELALMSDLKATMLPVTILYDSDAREIWRVAGPEDWASKRAARLLEEGLRKESSPPGR